MDRRRLPVVVVIVVVMQVAIPAHGLVARWTGRAEVSSFAWQMYSAVP